MIEFMCILSLIEDQCLRNERCLTAVMSRMFHCDMIVHVLGCTVLEQLPQASNDRDAWRIGYMHEESVPIIARVGLERFGRQADILRCD